MKTCQHRSQCERWAKWGLFGWAFGETNVNLANPLRVYCGQHKPKLDHTVRLRNVRIAR